MNPLPPAHGSVQRQIQLPLWKAAEIALKSLRVRFARNVLTLITIVMAIAFLTNVWGSGTLEPPIRAGQLAEKGVALAADSGGGRRVLLLTLSLLVCTVGIANAMLMSVMERFREIGTMKCLGALDAFILKLFLLESLFLGIAGTLLGVGIGLGLTLGILQLRYGASTWTYLPWMQLPLIAGGSLAIGMAITAAAALWPAWKAARMHPINAMRVDV